MAQVEDVVAADLDEVVPGLAPAVPRDTVQRNLEQDIGLPFQPQLVKLKSGVPFQILKVRTKI